MPPGAPSLLPDRSGGPPGVGSLPAQQPPRPDEQPPKRESSREAPPEQPEAPPFDSAALVQAVVQPFTALSALLASLGKPSGGAPTPGATNGVDCNFGRASSDPSADDASVPGGTSDFDAGAGAGEQAGGSIPLTEDGVLGFLEKLLYKFGNGATPNDIATKALGALVGIRGDGATLVSHRDAEERAANTDEALNNLQRQLREAIAKFGEIHAGNRQAIEDLIQKAVAHLRIANRLPNEADRKIRVGQILQVALQDAERIIGKEHSNTAQTDNKIKELTKQMTDQYVKDLGPVADSSTLGRFINAVFQQESTGRYGEVEKHTNAMGAYQIMPENLAGVDFGYHRKNLEKKWGSWDVDALGRPVSYGEFMRSPQIQDTIAGHKLTQYVQDYGYAGAAAKWYSGNENKVNSWRPVEYGPPVAQYVREVLGRM